MKVTVLIAEHPHQPGTIVAAFESAATAEEQAVSLVRIMAEDCGRKTPVTAENWREQLLALQKEFTCHVTLTEVRVCP